MLRKDAFDLRGGAGRPMCLPLATRSAGRRKP
jgi:hypothetical protein